MGIETDINNILYNLDPNVTVCSLCRLPYLHKAQLSIIGPSKYCIICSSSIYDMANIFRINGREILEHIYLNKRDVVLTADGVVTTFQKVVR